MKKKEIAKVTVREEDLLVLCELAEAILDCGDERVWCRGVGTTPSKLGKIIDRSRAEVRKPS